MDLKTLDHENKMNLWVMAEGETNVPSRLSLLFLYLQFKRLDSCSLDLHRKRCALILFDINSIISAGCTDYICEKERNPTNCE